MFEQELNKEQLAVVKNGDGPCLVLAGAGSGKTRTITYRVAHLLDRGVLPEEILLVTFTNKAAREMIERVESITKGGARLPWSGTFHHIAYRILKKYAPVLGYQNNFTILDSEDSRDLLKLSLKQEGIDRKERRFPSVRVVSSILSYARNAETTIEDVLDLKYPKWIDLADTLGRIAEDYAKRKREANAMDFDDLLVNLYLLLLKSERVRAKFAEQFRFVLVDEYQDTNKIQASIVRLFASVHKNILVVGDDAQSIYSFRAADIQNILQFEKEYPDAKVFRLETNYRSTPEILDVANEVIEHNTKQYSKQLKSIRDSFAKPELHAFVDQREEASFIAERILELREEGVSLPSIAVLFRAAYHSQTLEMELAKRDIPYDFRGGVRFFERAHIKDALAYLRVMHNESDVVAWSRALTMHVGIGPASAAKVIAAIQGEGIQKDIARFGSLMSARAQVGWSDFLSISEAVDAAGDAPADMIRAFAASSYTEYLEREYPDAKERLQDLEQLAVFAERAADLGTFLGEASLQESYTGAARRAADDDEEKIVLSTIHQAKGLEWEAVFVMHVAAGHFPNDRALSEADGLEEERRLFYVALTRAKRFLHLTYPLTTGYQSVLLGPSMFLEELSRDLLSEHRVDSGMVFTDPSDDIDDIVYVAEDEPFPSSPRPGRFLKSIDEL